MDTNKEYIKMCNHPKIQLDENGCQLITNFSVEDARIYWGRIAYRGDNVFAQFREGSSVECVRLLRQSQIQEMMPGGVAVGLLDRFNLEREKFITTAIYVDDWSMEQLWLAFYMYEIHSLVWSGNKWAEKNG